MSNDNTTPLLVRMNPELYDAVKAVALAEDRSMASVVRLAITRYVESSVGVREPPE